MQIKIRKATAKESEKLLELLITLGRPKPKDSDDYRKFKSLIEYYIDSKDEDRSILIATTDSRIVGLVSYVLLHRLNQRTSEFWIPELIVSEEYRNRGIGKLLIQKCESIAQKERCYRIRLESRNDREESHKFYSLLNFDQIAKVFEKRL